MFPLYLDESVYPKSYAPSAPNGRYAAKSGELRELSALSKKVD